LSGWPRGAVLKKEVWEGTQETRHFQQQFKHVVHFHCTTNKI